MASGWTLNRKCSIEGCDRKHYGKGLCQMHYHRQRARGTTDKHVCLVPPIERFERLFDRTSSCWLWKGTITVKGYGMFAPGPDGPKMVAAHRWAYEHYVESVPAGLQLDHLCRVRHCVNPAHLEPVTSKINQVRSPHDPAARTHCPKGHAYDDMNTYQYPDGRRGCRTCARAADAAYAARKRAGKGAGT